MKATAVAQIVVRPEGQSSRLGLTVAVMRARIAAMDGGFRDVLLSDVVGDGFVRPRAWRARGR